MSVHVTANPSAELPGSVIGKPVHLPAILLCTMGGERYCGWKRIANSQEQYLLMSAERREHEVGCRGGLIVASR